MSATCEASPGAGGSTTYAKRDFKLSKTDWALAYTVYGDAACQVSLGTIDMGGHYRLLGDSSRVSGAREAVFAFGSRTVTPASQGFVDFLAKTSCGAKPWAVGTSIDILPDGCGELGARPVAACASDNDIVSLDGNRLWFGQRPADNDMCTPDKRPQSLGANPVTKQ